MNNIFLIGMPGCGKSALGKLLAAELGREFYDADDELEKFYGRKISDIFAQDGEESFRLMETETVRRLSALNGAVIATGGGAVTREETMRIAKSAGVVIFIDRPVENILTDIVTGHRPLLAGGAQRLHQLYRDRIAQYRNYADITVANTADPESAVQNMIKGVKEYENHGN